MPTRNGRADSGLAWAMDEPRGDRNTFPLPRSNPGTLPNNAPERSVPLGRPCHYLWDLVTQAILSTPHQRSTVLEIGQWIQDHIPHYKAMTGQNVRNAVSSTLKKHYLPASEQGVRTRRFEVDVRKAEWIGESSKALWRVSSTLSTQ